MTTMIAELYDALKEAGASEEKAKAAAQAIADYERHFVHIESKLESLESEIKIVKAELGIIKWLAGLGIAGIISLVFKAFI